jgi:hypothetical protein
MRNDRPYMVIRTDNHGGFSVRATSPEEAVRKAMKYATMKGAVEVEVRGLCHRERVTIKVS